MKHLTKILLILLIALQSCSDKKPESKNLNETFTWNIQRAGYDFDQYDLEGAIDFKNFIIEFEKFPWIEELNKANSNPNKCSPTLSVVDEKNNRTLWISIAGDISEFRFIIGYVYPKEKKEFLGLGESKNIKWVEMFLTQDTGFIRNCFELQFNYDYEKLYSKIATLEKYGEVEAEN